VFGLSLLGLIVCLARPARTRAHGALGFLAAATVSMALMILHPTTNTLMAGLAQTGMHLAVAAPLYWAPGYFLGDYQRLGRVLTILWLLNAASAVVGILQVRDPDRWMPRELSSVVTARSHDISIYQYQADDGRVVMRPPGLGDYPGAACGAGMFTAAVGLAYLGLPVSPLRRLLGLLVGTAGVTVIFLTHVRSALVVLAGSAVVYAMVLILQKRVLTGLVLAGAITVGAVGSIWYASSLVGRSVIDRFATLLEADPLTVYQRSQRLAMVTQTFDTLIFDYPLGAGLGRWGMMRQYFGDERNRDSPMIGTDVQLAAWVLDGGVVLLALYVIAIVVAIARLLWLSLDHRSRLRRQWVAVIIMLSAGPVALIFSFTPFHSQMGMQFWFLIGAFEGAVQGEERAMRSRPRPGVRSRIPR
jgi:hypothetical protein